MPFECRVDPTEIKIGQSVTITGIASGGDSDARCVKVGYGGDSSNDASSASYSFTINTEGVHRPYAEFEIPGGYSTANGSKIVVDDPNN